MYYNQAITRLVFKRIHRVLQGNISSYFVRSLNRPQCHLKWSIKKNYVRETPLYTRFYINTND